MPKLTIEISGPDDGLITDLLDDVVALVHNGHPGHDGECDQHRVRFAWVEEDDELPPRA